jgi:hypothetical protein
VLGGARRIGETAWSSSVKPESRSERSGVREMSGFWTHGVGFLVHEQVDVIRLFAYRKIRSCTCASSGSL